MHAAYSPSTSIAIPFCLSVPGSRGAAPRLVSSRLVSHAPAPASTHTHTLSLSLSLGSRGANPLSLTSPLCTSSVPFGNADTHRTRNPLKLAGRLTIYLSPPETVCSVHTLLFHFSSFDVLQRSEVMGIYISRGRRLIGPTGLRSPGTNCIC